ncbi:MAG: methionine--tRNA ligase, partial [Bacteroidia bacterium]|nr:methionine--tRNA ligase [Bacteroidia bacterium]
KEGITPQEVVDKYHAVIKKAFQDFNISFDIYSRTSNAIHHKTASDFFEHLYKNGKFEEYVTEQFYDETNQQFVADRFLKGTCPKCGNPDAYGDQCEKCGSTLNPTDLINPVSRITGKPLSLKKTKHWFLPLNQYQKILQDWINAHAAKWKTNVVGQCMSWLNEGLQPRAVTRDLDWGVKVPASIPGSENKVLYVWFDAPIGYISATKEWAIEQNNPDAWKKYWLQQPNEQDNARLIHFIGKDNIVFHCIVFPAMLIAHGGYILPENVPANEFLNIEGDKISTSRNWAVWLHEFAEKFPSKIDVLRYVLTATMPETKDNDFSWIDFQQRNNNELVATLGNFVNRVFTLIGKYFQGRVPELADSSAITEYSLIQSFLQYEKEQTKTWASVIGEYIENYRFRDALQTIMAFAMKGNKFLQETEPWKTIQSNPKQTAIDLFHAVQMVAHLAIWLEPFMPATAQKLQNSLQIDQATWNLSQEWAIVPQGTAITQIGLLFEKIENDFVQAQIEYLIKNTDTLQLEHLVEKKAPLSNYAQQELIQRKQSQKVAASAAIPDFLPLISYEDFAKIDIRIATIVQAEKVPKTDKLLKLTLDTGKDIRTVVSGIAQHYKPEELIGKQVPVLVNLAPRTLRGIESQGMVLMADAEGRLCLLHPQYTVANGSVIR